MDSGPSELGIVAHQFTCPAGLFFNKLADSCDYTRNVQCSKPKSTTTKAIPAATSTTSTTTSAPARTSAAPKRNFASIRPLIRSKPTTTTTTTTTEAYIEEQEEYDEDEYDDEVAGSDGLGASQVALDSEDPKVIKELIDLIKKVGGIEELEKQLKQNQDGSHVLYDPNQSTTVTTTPPSIHKKLYEKILRKPIPGVASSAVKDIAVAEVIRPVAESTTVASASSQLPKYSSIYRATNSRPGPQNDGLDSFAETEGLRNDKPQYITITRNRPQAVPVQKEQQEVGVDDEEEEEESEASSEDISITRSTEPTFVRYTIPEHVEVTGHDASYRLTGGGYDEQTQPSSSTPYVTIYRTTALPQTSRDKATTSSM